MAEGRNPERDLAISRERAKGRTYADIGREFGISGSQVAVVCHKVERRQKEVETGPWYAALSTRAQNMLKSFNLTNRDDAIAAFSADDQPKIYNAGAKTISEVKDALGIDEPAKPLTPRELVTKWKSGEIDAERAMWLLSERYD